MIGKQQQSWVRFVQMIRLFFSCEARWTTISWFALLVGVLLTTVGLNVVNSYVGRDFMTAIVEKQWGAFLTYGLVYLVVIALSTIAATFSRFSEERFRLLWRGWLTRLLIDLYMSRDRFYRLKALEEIDRPEEQITEDVKAYTQATLSFLLVTLNAAITSLAFLGVLWSIAPWMAMVALTYAAAGSAIMIRLGRPLIRLGNLQIQKEVAFRYHLIRAREAAVGIVTTGSARTVRDSLRGRLTEVIWNCKRMIAVTRNLGLFTYGYNSLTPLIPLAIVAPMYMRGRVEFGVVTQSAMAFATFLGGFSLMVAQFETLSSFAVVTDRIDTMMQGLETTRTPTASPIHVSHDEDRVAYQNLSLWSGREHRPLVDGLTLEVLRGENLLITGLYTAAEQALFLATAGFWDRGSGQIIRPGPEGIHFVSSQPPTVGGSLRSRLITGSPHRWPSDVEIMEMLMEVGGEAAVFRAGGLDADLQGPESLSAAEQCLVLVARALLQRPTFVFLDRVGEVLDEEQIEKVYRLLRQEGTGYLSIGDFDRLAVYHDRVLIIHGEGRWEVTPVRVALADGGPADVAAEGLP